MPAVREPRRLRVRQGGNRARFLRRTGGQSKKPEDEAKRHEWFLRGVPESEERLEGWQSVAELAQEYGLSYHHMYSLLRKSGARPVAKIRTNFSRSSVTTAYYSAAEAVQLIVMHCAQTGNQRMLDWFDACGV